MKRQALVNSILETLGGKIQVEVGNLLGCQIVLTPPTIGIFSKEDFFGQFLKKLAMARIAAEGDRTGEAYLFAQVKDAVLLGGTLIMLPASEMEERIAQEEFGGEEADAFGEIANIIAGVLTTAFDEYFPEKLRFVKRALETVVPSKVTADSPHPFPDGSFCQAFYGLTMDGRTLSPIQLLFPAELLGLAAEARPAAEPSREASAPQARTVSAGANQAAGLAEVFADTSAPAGTVPPVPPVPPVVEASAPEASSAPPPSSVVAAASRAEAAVFREEPLSPASAGTSPSPPAAGPAMGSAADPAGAPEEPTVLVLAEDPSESSSFAAVLQQKGYSVRSFALKDDIRRILSDVSVKGVFLVMQEVTEQGFAAAIRVKSAGARPVPLIAAGPQWTRKTVLQAVKYGVCDIVMTPATPQEIGEKIDRHLAAAGA